ncbi:MAG: hypothetical protein P1U70_07605 [Saprospiraceae bacterium]|jgi:hypothetical protein|nr:hypothetical protein [Saprospiraceae bacterium]
MSFPFRICRNDTTSMLRDLFNATPLKVPESRVRPLIIIAEKNGKTDFRGDLKHLMEEGVAFDLQPKESTVTDVSLEKTKSIDFDFGFDILKGFFEGFGIPSGSMATQLKGAKSISLSFNNVKRVWIDKNELGSHLRGKKIDIEHPSMTPFLDADPYQMLLISDAIVSNSFTINIDKSNDSNFEVKLPEIEQVLENANAKVQVKKTSKNSITFEGDEYLTFAFSCIQLQVKESGTLGVGMTFLTRDADGKEVEVYEDEPSHVELDEDLFQPGMLVFD